MVGSELRDRLLHVSNLSMKRVLHSSTLITEHTLEAFVMWDHALHDFEHDAEAR